MNINKCAPELINDTPRFQLARQGASNRRGGAKRAERAAEKERGRERDSWAEDSVQDNLQGRSISFNIRRKAGEGG